MKAASATTALVYVLCALGTGCGGGGGSSAPVAGSGGGQVGPTSGGGAMSTGGSSSSSGSGAAGVGGSTGVADGGGTTCATPDAWDVTYNLDGSTFEVRDTPAGIGDQVNTCKPPYTDNDEIGPGTMVIRFTDANGSPGAGPAYIMNFTMSLEFTVATVTTANTNLTQQSVAGVCGAATGSFSDSVIKWSDPGLNLHTFGNITCTGSLCTIGGLQDGVPQPNDDTGPQVLTDFTFTNGVGSFSMPAVLNTKDSSSSEWITFKGTETSRKAVCNCE